MQGENSARCATGDFLSPADRSARMQFVCWHIVFRGARFTGPLEFTKSSEKEMRHG